MCALRTTFCKVDISKILEIRMTALSLKPIHLWSLLCFSCTQHTFALEQELSKDVLKYIEIGLLFM